MSTTTPCPSAQQLDDLLANRLSTQEAEQIRNHLSTCPICIGSRSRATDDTQTPTYSFLSPPREKGELGWLDHHRVLGVLGQGAMAIVFDAEDVQLGRRVALKVMRPHLCDPTTRERFLREARLIAGLPHDHIVTVFRVGEANGVPYLTMERLQGESLEDRLQREKWLPLAEAISLTCEAAEGLVVAHDAGLVHRDVKPANIWLESRNGQFRRVKLIDFGIARMVHQEAGLTAQGQVVGTPMYMAPEQASSRAIDGRADLYSLGCVLFQMVTGRTPFEDKQTNTMALLHKIIVEETPSVRLLAPELPESVADLIQDLLAKDPDHRPVNARALVERLTNLEATVCSEVVPPPPTVSSSNGQTLMRRPGLLGIWLGAIAISAAILVSVTTLIVKLSHPTPKPFKLGLLHSFTEGMRMHEQSVALATRFAVDEINEAPGGIAGRKIEIVEEDGRSNDDEFARGARNLIEQQEVDVIFGCWTSSSRKRVAEVCAEFDRLLFYSPMSEGLENSPNVVYLGGVPNQTVVPMVNWAYREKNKRRFYLLGTDAIFSRSINKILQHEIEKLGAEVTGTKYVAFGETNFSSMIELLKATKTDALVNTIDAQSNIALFNALRNAGITSETVSTFWVTSSEVELSMFPTRKVIGDYSVGCYFDSLTRKSNREFVERFRKKYGSGEHVNDAMQTAYFGVYLWKDALEKIFARGEQPDFGNLRQTLRGLSVEAPEGLIQLDKNNQHAYRTARIGEIVSSDVGLEFSIVYSSPDPLRPEPFPRWRTEDQWREFLHGLYQSWGDRWVNPRTKYKGSKSDRL